MGYDGKYGRVTTERGNIPDDEPVIVFRARDILLPSVLQEYRQLCQSAGSPQRHIDIIEEAISRIAQWQHVNHTQVPQSAGMEGNDGRTE